MKIIKSAALELQSVLRDFFHNLEQRWNPQMLSDTLIQHLKQIPSIPQDVIKAAYEYDRSVGRDPNRANVALQKLKQFNNSPQPVAPPQDVATTGINNRF